MLAANTKLTKRQYQDLWDDFKENIRNATPIDAEETHEQKKKRMDWLERPGNEEEWFKYYFPDFASDEPAPFHRAATRRIINNPEWYDVRNWSRELAKSTRSMLEDFYLFFVGHVVKKEDGTIERVKKYFKIILSSTNDAAVLLLLPYKANLEDNARLIHDYGKQQKIGSWDPDFIITRSGFGIKAFGADQKPRGTRNKHRRPDIIEFDDFDTDEACLNLDRVDKSWKFANKAAIMTRSMSKPTIIRWLGNIIAEDCCIVRAQEFADKVDIINIRDDNGKSTWKKNSEEFIDRILKILPFSAQQSECFNNPYTEGKAFKEVKWGKVPKLNKFPYLVQYGDPATSNKDRGKGNSKTSMKAVVLLGMLDQVYYVIKCRLDQMTNAKFVDCFYQMSAYVGSKAQLHSYIENNGLQNPFYEQVFVPLFFIKASEFGRMVSIIPDNRDKPDKYTRIEGTLEPLNRLKCLVFNEDEQDDEDMKRLVSQLKSVSPMSKTMDGPDAVEGGVVKINERIFTTGGIEIFVRPDNNYRM